MRLNDNGTSKKTSVLLWIVQGLLATLTPLVISEHWLAEHRLMDLHGLGVVEHGPHQARHLLHRLALVAQAQHEACDLGRGGVALKDVAQHRRSVVRRERLASLQPRQDTGPAPQVIDRHGPPPTPATGSADRAGAAPRTRSAPRDPTAQRRRQAAPAGGQDRSGSGSWTN